MKLTKKSEYACLALLQLAKHPEERQTITTIAAQYDIPQKFLESILLSLKQNNFLESKRGPKGGYKLAKSPSDITIAEIVRIMDGPIAPVSAVSKHYYKPSPIAKSDRLTYLFAEIRNIVAQKLENISLQDVVENEHIQILNQ